MRSHTLHHSLLCGIALITQVGTARAGSSADFPDVPEPKATPSRGSFDATLVAARPVSTVQTAAPSPALAFAPQTATSGSSAPYVAPPRYIPAKNDNPYLENQTSPPARTATPDKPDSVEESIERRRRREAWMLSIEGVTHAPVDVGVQVGLETPQRLRLFAGYGWVPGSYMSLLTGIASSASGNRYAQAFLDNANYSGRTWRLQGGFRPFPGIGLYADVGYAHVNAVGSLDLTVSGIPTVGSVSGGYEADTTLHMWLVELGYQGEIGNSVVLALALGCMGTLSSKTTITPLESAPRSNVLNTAAADTDAALEKYGYAPTLTLRLGFDLI